MARPDEKWLRELRAADIDWQKQLRVVLAELDRVRAGYEERLSTEREKRLDERAVSAKDSIEAALAAAEKALGLATSELKDRLALLNELRGNVLDRTAFDAYVKQQDERYEQILAAIGELRTDVAVGPSSIPALQHADAQRAGSERGRQQQSQHTLALIVAISAVAAVAISVIGLFLTAALILVTFAATGNL